jgi:hypothetical protein
MRDFFCEVGVGAWGFHRVYRPSPNEPLNFEGTIELTLLDLHARFRVAKILFDPWQMQATSQRLQKRGLRIEEFPQSVGNLTTVSQNLYELIQGRNLVVYPDVDMRLAVRHSVAVETPRGWRISKEKQSHKIDVVVALAMAARATVQGGIAHPPLHVTDAALRNLAGPRMPSVFWGY